ncbi:MAG: alanine racemase [Faecalimonas umbilicata]|uniref:alanine racemase n=1 Tax=Faecalimonas umbilicata TaxID=1912855 RepID=UPI002A74C2A5|nr:alanine racemase [Faecalimonas umbilicata]MDY2761558.1 alanine racemase [Faecalimonas umbilicata]
MKTYSRVYAKIDLDAVAWNMEQMKKNLKEGTEMVAVIKTDGYGHGAVQVASMLESYDYVWGYAVATLDEAVVLRAAEIQKPILVLGCIFPDQYWEMLKYEIRMNVYTKEMAEAISALAVEKGEQAYVHIKLDTGMARLGFSAEESSIEEIKEIAELPNLVLEGVFTHFAKADEEDKMFTMMQLEKFEWMTQRLEEEGVTFPYVHASNSAGIIDVRRADYNLVRAGIAIYGLYPSEEVDKEKVQLKPALSLKSHIAFVKDIPAGTPVSYGGDFVSEHQMRIATIPIGYGDGYPRSLSDTGYVLIRGKKAPIIGRICMDQFMVDVSDIPEVKFGDKVTLIGRDQEEYLPVEKLSELSGRFNYEFVCDLGKRIPRVYVQDGKVEEQVDYFA